MIKKRKLKAYELIAVSAFILMLLAYSLHHISNLDFWLHLKAGECMVKELNIIKTNTFSYIAADNPWTNVYWLFQGLIYIIYYLGGFAGLILFKAFILLVSFLFLFKTMNPEGNKKYLLSLFCLIPAVLVANERFIIRPELMSLFFICLYIHILYRYQKENTRLIYLLPFLQIIWANMHGLAVIGIGLIGLFLAGELFTWLCPLPFKWKERKTNRGKNCGRLFLVGVLAALASLVNPFGTRIISLYLGLPKALMASGAGSGGFTMPQVIELLPPLKENFLFPTQVVFYFKILLIISGLSFLLNIKKIKLTDVFIFLSFLYLALQARRNLPFFAVIAAVIMFFNLAGFWEEIHPRMTSFFKDKAKLKKAAFIGCYLFITAAMLIFAYDAASNRYHLRDRSNKRFGLDISRITYPVKAVDFIEEHHLSGNMFNNIGIGDYLTFRLYPQQRVFLDGRFDMGGNSFLYQYGSPKLWPMLVKRFNLNFAVIEYGWTPGAGDLMKKLYYDPDWAMIYYDEIAVIYLKNTPENKALITKFNIDLSQEKSPKEISSLDNGGGVLQKLYYNLVRPRDIPVGRLHLGNFYAIFSLYDRAIAQYQQCLETAPDYFEAHYRLGDVLQKMKQFEKAVHPYNQCIKIKPNFAQGYAGLGDVYYSLRNLRKAKSYYKTALNIKPKLTSAHQNLGFIYIQEGKYREAVAEFESILKIEPDNKMVARIYNIYKKKLSE